MTSSKRQKKSAWDNKLKSPSHIHAKDPNGKWTDCKYCETSAGVCTRLSVRRPFNNEYWNRHVVLQSHLDMVVKKSGIATIHTRGVVQNCEKEEGNETQSIRGNKCTVTRTTCNKKNT